jgi:predicted MFS family arabinose efflux permease
MFLRGIFLMFLKILAYFVPFAINFLSGGFFFITSHRFAEASAPGIIIGSATAAWGIAYCAVTAIVGKLVNGANALKFILSGGVMLMITALGFIIFNGLYTQFVWLICAGVGAAMFCTPFQLLAKAIESGGETPGTVKATAFYTLTWSTGIATGPLAFARFSVRTGFIITFILALAVTVSVMIIARLLKNKEKNCNTVDCDTAAKEKETEIFSEKDYNKLAILGWIVGGLGTITVCQIRSMWPKHGYFLAISKDHIAYILALVSYIQAFTALLLCRSETWMWRKVPALLMTLPAVLSLLLFAFATDLKIFYAAAVIYGIYSGTFYFYLVYHSLAHPTRSRFFVAGNEVIVGIVNLLAPVIGGMFVDITGFTGSPFIFALAMAAAAFTAQMVILNSIKQPVVK